ncbi:MAG TPA: NAD(P)H-hydrate dehydratase [Lacunisphaera sp.]|jgi:NAD(P)H-hydrate epimerase|nr:NAD(P)H-hydrate dehydratase [Lacunisphaera sp.]
MPTIPSYPVLTGPEAKAWEAGALQGEAQEWAAMVEAGTKLAQALLEDFREIGGLPAAAAILVLVGKGHNGGDALLAAREILVRCPGATATVVLCFGAGELRPLAGRALDRLKADGSGRVQLAAAAKALAAERAYALCLDGIFGFNFRPPLSGAAGEIIEATNAHPAIQLRAAVDLPSGVGEKSAATVFRADFTYATGIVKFPVLHARNVNAVGRLRFLNLGLMRADAVPAAHERMLTGELLTPLAMLRPSQTDKRTYGHLLVVGGSRSYPGAVLLAVRAALRSGVGLVTAIVPAQLAPEYAARHPEAMWVGCAEHDDGGLDASCLPAVRERAERATALLVGPGLGSAEHTIAFAAHLAGEVQVPLVLDADALRREVFEHVREKTFIATPHAGEFQRIAPVLFSDGKFTAPRGVLVLKGPMTRVTDGHLIYHSPFGGPVLARGGSGDILAGLVGGLLAQAADDPVLAACRGVVWHGHAADLLARARGQVSVETTQLLEQLGPALTPDPWQIH